MNGSLEDLLTLAPGLPRRSHVRLTDPSWDDAAPLPPPSQHTLDEIDRFLDELESDALDLALRLEVLDAMARALPPGTEGAVRAQVGTLVTLRGALDEVRARASDHRLAHFVASDAPLGAYLKGVHQRAAMTARALERHAAGLRQGAPDRAALARDLTEASAFRFSWLVDSIRRDVGATRLGVGSAGLALRVFRAALERLFAATEQLDAGLA